MTNIAIRVGCGIVEVGTHRAATGRERRADVTLCHYTSAELLQQRYMTIRFCESDRDDSIWRAAPFWSRLCGRRLQARADDRAPFLTRLAHSFGCGLTTTCTLGT
ncbi:MAG TPA: hypothetical protein VGQ81_07935 [Acidobacteriota bacterium]|nr:hypothetical protein [Acidobacteriota bacterium]